MKMKKSEKKKKRIFDKLAFFSSQLGFNPLPRPKKVKLSQKWVKIESKTIVQKLGKIKSQFWVDFWLIIFHCEFSSFLLNFFDFPNFHRSRSYFSSSNTDLIFIVCWWSCTFFIQLIFFSSRFSWKFHNYLLQLTLSVNVNWSSSNFLYFH